MAAEIPEQFCQRCLCPGCVAQSRKLWEIQQEEKRLEDEAAAEELARWEVRRAKEAELMQQSAMIWMITNLAKDAGEVRIYVNLLAEALDISTTMVNARRTIYVTALNKRAGITERFRFKPPGTRDTEEPDWCEKCSGLKTKGRSCRRKSCRKQAAP